MLTTFVQFLINVFAALLNVMISVLPISPFQSYFETFSLEYGDILGYINYFLPISTFLVILCLWLTAVAVYYAWSVLARWVKLIK